MSHIVSHIYIDTDPNEEVSIPNGATLLTSQGETFYLEDYGALREIAACHNAMKETIEFLALETAQGDSVWLLQCRYFADHQPDPREAFKESIKLERRVCFLFDDFDAALAAYFGKQRDALPMQRSEAIA